MVLGEKTESSSGDMEFGLRLRPYSPSFVHWPESSALAYVLRWQHQIQCGFSLPYPLSTLFSFHTFSSEVACEEVRKIDDNCMTYLRRILCGAYAYLLHTVLCDVVDGKSALEDLNFCFEFWNNRFRFSPPRSHASSVKYFQGLLRYCKPILGRFSRQAQIDFFHILLN